MFIYRYKQKLKEEAEKKASSESVVKTKLEENEKDIDEQIEDVAEQTAEGEQKEQEDKADDMTVPQIKSRLDELEVDYKSNATKDDLLALLESTEQKDTKEGD